MNRDRGQLHDICLTCGHKIDEHSPDGSRCYKAYCTCSGYRTTFVQFGEDADIKSLYSLKYIRYC